MLRARPPPAALRPLERLSLCKLCLLYPYYFKFFDHNSSTIYTVALVFLYNLPFTPALYPQTYHVQPVTSRSPLPSDRCQAGHIYGRPGGTANGGPDLIHAVRQTIFVKIKLTSTTPVSGVARFLSIFVPYNNLVMLQIGIANQTKQPHCLNTTVSNS